MCRISSWENGGLEKLSNFLFFEYLESGQAKILTQVCLTLKSGHLTTWPHPVYKKRCRWYQKPFISPEIWAGGVLPHSENFRWVLIFFCHISRHFFKLFNLLKGLAALESKFISRNLPYKFWFGGRFLMPCISWEIIGSI